MAKEAFPITNGFYENDSLPFSAQRCINWYPNYTENAALAPALLYGVPGQTEIADTGTLEFNRGAHVMAQVAYFVNGETLYQLERTVTPSGDVFNAIPKGTVIGSERVSMSDNGTQLCIVVPKKRGYIYNKDTDVFEEITDPDFTANGKSERVVFVDGYFVHIAGSIIFHSELNDGLSYNALDFGTAEADPDPIVSSFVLKNQLFILGLETIEVFANVGKFPFTFQRIPGFFQSIGCFARFSAVLVNNLLAFVGGSTNEKIGVFIGAGNNFQRISTTPIEQKLQTLPEEDIRKIFCWSYSEGGSIFLGVSTTGDEFTFVYDFKASQIAGRPIWHERSSLFTPNNSDIRWRPNSVIKAYERILVGDSASGKIGELDRKVYDEYGNRILRRIRTQPLANKSERIFCDEIELTINSGATTDENADPQIRMQYSDDAINYKGERFASMGKQGQYDRRVFWRRLGNIPRFRVWEFLMTDQTDPTVIKSEIRFDAVAE